MTERTSASLGRLRQTIGLLLESVESYERNGIRTLDKLQSDLAMVSRAIIDVAIEIGRSA